MRRSLLGVAAFAAGLSVAATRVGAQDTTTTTTTSTSSTTSTPRPVQFGVSGGISLPTGDFGNFVNTGYNLNGFIEGRPGGGNVGLRGEFTFAHFAFDES